MIKKIGIELGEIQKTLIFPLWGRAYETGKKNPMLKDAKAVEIINSLDYDFTGLASKMNPISQLAWIARSIHIDRTVTEFIKKNPDATIVNIGCGMDTTFDRIDNGKILWYDLDMEDAIRLRKIFFNETDRRKFIPSSFLDIDWFRQIPKPGHIFFISAGVFYYFEEIQIRNFFKSLADNFTNSQLIFDMATVSGVKISNKKVIESGGLGSGSFLKWGIDSARTIEKWDERYEIIDEYNMFRGMKKNLSLKGKIGTTISDLLNIMHMVHLKIG